ncbi:AraC family transcriptional regulator [Halomonas nitroreducens]|uniref:AraC family transcriptional regulator n=1 Tax=Halomonas nitroreducens TaxID=447425 RepID=A0A431V0M7_9GAMM|nr:AraC family transcriptional regulator [Halomonas nitroreducens]RTR01065.1 AraC family transcriptional regulator [Halomonas nitroreducens]
MDRLAALLSSFHLAASVFNAGPLCYSSRHPAQAGMGFVHILTHGSVHLGLADGTQRRFDEPVLILLAAGDAHRLEPGPQGTETLCGSFRFGAGNLCPIYRALPALLVIPLDRLSGMAGLLDLMQAEMREQRCGRQATLDRLCELLVIQLLRYLMDAGEVDSGLLAGLAHSRLTKALIAMHDRPAADWTLRGLATEAGMSRARFASVFRDTVGQPPAEYLAQYRLSLAKTLLRDGLPLDTIADRVGYSSPSALAKVFRRHTGHSPLEWRSADAEASPSGQETRGADRDIPD